MSAKNLSDVWKSGGELPPDDSSGDRMFSEVRRVRNTYWRRNLLTLLAFVLVVVVSGYFVQQLQLDEPLSRAGLYVGLAAMTLILVLKWFRHTGLSVPRLHESNTAFIARATRRLRYARWVLTWGAAGYIVLFGVAFGMVFPELFHDRELKVQILGLVIGYGYLAIMAVQGIYRARREYERDVAPVVQRLERAAAEMQA